MQSTPTWADRIILKSKIIETVPDCYCKQIVSTDNWDLSFDWQSLSLKMKYEKEGLCMIEFVIEDMCFHAWEEINQLNE